MKLRSVFLAVMLIMFSGSGLLAQTKFQPGGRGTMQPDPVAKLDRVLQSAGAKALGDTQREQLTTLVNDFRTARQNSAPDAALQDARRDLEAAILSGNEGAVDSAAAAVSSEMSRRATVMIRDLARFEIQVLKILTPDQVNALKTQYGNSGLIHTLGALAGWHGGMRRGMGWGMPGRGR